MSDIRVKKNLGLKKLSFFVTKSYLFENLTTLLNLWVILHFKTHINGLSSIIGN